MSVTASGFRRAVIAAILIIALIGGGLWGYRRLTAQRGTVRYITRPVAYADIAPFYSRVEPSD